MEPHVTVLFVARYTWPFRLLAVLFAGLFAVLRPSVSAMWQESGWFVGLSVLLGYLFAFFGLLETFVRQTWLTDAGIHQRSMFGQTRFIPYATVRELVIKREESLIIKAQDNRSLKVHAKEGHPDVIIDVMRRFLDAEVRVVTV